MSVVKRYTKKPVTIEAIQFTGGKGGIAALNEWIGKYHGLGYLGLASEPVYAPVGDINGTHQLVGYEDVPTIDTLEGSLKVSVGDWIIRGIKGEFYPCKPDIFALTYDESVQ